MLVTFGATWDAKCDELVSSGDAWREALALQICMLLWTQEHADDLPFTEVPLEVIQRGAGSTQAYIDDVKTSYEIVLRRKICLVGCGCAGKTSLVKSITSETPQLTHVDDHTRGEISTPNIYGTKQEVSVGIRYSVPRMYFWKQ
jgi:hypothetical protein